MTLKQKIKGTGITLGLVGILAFNEGCATPEGNAVGSAFLGIASTPSARDTDFDKIGKFGAGLGSVYTGAAAQRQLQEAGATRVNVNVNTNQPGYVQAKDYVIYAREDNGRFTIIYGEYLGQEDGFVRFKEGNNYRLIPQYLVQKIENN